MAVAMLEPLPSAGAAAANTLSGTATFSKVSFGVQLNISVMHCTDGKTYPVHIHEGSSCADAMSQGVHWGAEMPAADSGAGGASGNAGNAGQSGTPAAGSGGASSAGSGGGHAGAAAQAGGGGAAQAGAGGALPPTTMTLKVRGEGIPDITCMGGIGTSMHTRSTPDSRTTWSIGGDERSNVIGHVLVVHDGATRIACGKIMMQ
jgi:hypothetical protein